MKHQKTVDAQLFKHSSYWFIAVGASAALVHYVVAVTINQFSIVTAGVANVIGFGIAFPVSYFGHRLLSFAQQQTSHQQTLPRFLLVASGGFFANQLLLLLCLQYTNLPFWLALGLVMIIIAVTTYLLSRYWAFKAK